MHNMLNPVEYFFFPTGKKKFVLKYGRNKKNRKQPDGSFEKKKRINRVTP
jgi:hypothetical protein